MALLIVIPRNSHGALVNLLARVAGHDWERSAQLHVFAIHDECEASDADEVFQYCQAHQIRDVLVPGRIHLKEQRLSDADYTVRRASSVKNLLHGDGLTKHLAELKLDWRSKLLERARHFAHGTIDSDMVDRWLKQFERLGNHRTVGEHLLQLLDVPTTTELGDCICAGSQFFDSDLVVGFNGDKWGKSWSVISNLIRKRCASAELFPISEAFDASQYPKVLRLVEDGLFSGTETCSVFDSLRGIRPPGRNKVAKLTDPSLLSRVPTQLHFGAICDFGERVVRRYMALNRLPNVQVSTGAAVRKFRVLVAPRPEVSASLLDLSDAEFQEHLYQQSVPYAFQSDKGWPDERSRQRAMRFCQQVGAQLWDRFIRRKFGDTFDANRWPPGRVERCGLGMDGLGLAFAFPHSVPRATLPVFWAEGEVTIDGARLNWTPLFPNFDK
jgi:hypothetical protein